MPRPETSDRCQKALLYSFEGPDEYGEPKVNDTAVELTVRWTLVQKDMLDPQGHQISIDAEVHVDREIVLGSVMWLGGTADLVGTSGYPLDDLMKVVNYRESRDIKGQHIRREVSLTRLSNSMPEVV